MHISPCLSSDFNITILNRKGKCLIFRILSDKLTSIFQKIYSCLKISFMQSLRKNNLFSFSNRIRLCISVIIKGWWLFECILLTLLIVIVYTQFIILPNHNSIVGTRETLGALVPFTLIREYSCKK